MQGAANVWIGGRCCSPPASAGPARPQPHPAACACLPACAAQPIPENTPPASNGWGWGQGQGPGLEAEEARLQERLFKLKLEHYVMEGDGSCQFRAVSFGLYGGRGRCLCNCCMPMALPARSGPPRCCSHATAMRRAPSMLPPPHLGPPTLSLSTPVPSAGTQRHHTYVRRKAVQYMQQRRQDFEAFLGEDFGGYMR